MHDLCTPKVVSLAEKLYHYMPQICWQTESNMAAALSVSRRQLRYAKQYLVATGRVRIEERPNGKRANPIHTIIKVNPINQYIEDVDLDGKIGNIDWSLFNNFAVKDLNCMDVHEQLEFYQEIGLQTVPLHYPKFKRGLVYCSCKSGRNCHSIGKHPATAYKSLDFTDKRTYKAMQSFWRDDVNYNIGFIVNGYIVLDVDYRKSGQYSLGYLQDELGEIPVGLSVATGNGRHIYVKSGARDIPNSVAVMGLPGLDVRSSGGIVTAPCSVHPSEKQYEWEIVSEPGQLPDSWRLNLQGAANTLMQDRKQVRITPQLGDLLPTKLDANYVIPEGQRNRKLFLFACRERGKGSNQDHILDIVSTINETYCEPKLKDSEIMNIARSAMRYESEAEKRQQMVNL